MKKIKVHIADNHKIIIDGIKTLLESENIDVVGSSANGRDFIKWQKNNTCDILILDISMPNGNGIEVLTYLKENNISLKTVILSSYKDETIINKTINLGAYGYVLKQDAHSCLIEALKEVKKGKRFFSKNVPVIANFLHENFNIENHLSPNELKVTELLSQDMNSKEIIKKLTIKPSTYRTYTQRARTKFKVKTNVGLVLLYNKLKSKNRSMKKIITLLLLMAFYNANSQNTTETEYKYMTKGLKVQIDSGLDTKRGYFIKPLTKITEGDYQFVYSLLLREKGSQNYSKGDYVGLIVIGGSSVSGKIYYRAIPFQTVTFNAVEKALKERLNTMFKKDISKWDEAMTTAYAVSTSKVLASLMEFYGKPFIKK